MQQLTAKERMQIPRHHMIEQDALERGRNFKEVNLGYTAEMAKEEAMRRKIFENPIRVIIREAAVLAETDVPEYDAVLAKVTRRAKFENIPLETEADNAETENKVEDNIELEEVDND